MKRICLAIPPGVPYTLDDEEFLTHAFHTGQVLTEEELHEKLHQNPEQFNKCEMRVVDLYETCWEMCPECECEVELKTEFKVQVCPSCGKPIVPCNLCSGKCPSPCPLGAK